MANVPKTAGGTVTCVESRQGCLSLQAPYYLMKVQVLHPRVSAALRFPTGCITRLHLSLGHYLLHPSVRMSKRLSKTCLSLTLPPTRLAAGGGRR